MQNRLVHKYSALPIQVKASVWFFICAFLQKGISSITVPIFTRLLTTAEYGQYSVFNSWLGVVTIFVTLNLSAGVYGQGLVKFEDERNIFVSSLQGLTLVLTVLWLIVYLLFRDFWNALFSLTTVQMLAMFLMIWTSAVFSFWSAEQRVKFSYKKLIILTFFISLAKPIVGIILVVNARDKVTARILGLVLVELIGYFGLFVTQMKRGKRFFVGKYWRYALLFNLPLIPHYLSQTVLNSADRIMIGNMVGEAEAGIYSLAYSVSLLMTLFNQSLSLTLGPWMYKKIKIKRAVDIPKVAYVALILVAVINIFLIAFAPEVVRFFAPAEYSDAIWVMPPIAMSVYFMFAYDLFARFEFYYEKTKFILFASVIAAVVNIALNYVFINLFGYYAAGYTTLVCYIVYTLMHYLSMRNICKTNIGEEEIFKFNTLCTISVVFLLIGFLFLFIYKLWYLRYAFVAVIGITVILKRQKIIEMFGVLEVKI